MGKPNSIDPNTGFCRETKTFHSLRPPVPLPPPSQPLSIAQFCLSLVSASATPPSAPFLVDSATGHRLTFSQFVRQTRDLALHLRRTYSLSAGDVAFVLCPYSSRVPVLYFSLLSLGVVVSPANPLSSESELAHLVRISEPVIAFAADQTAYKLPEGLIRLGTVIVDSAEFGSVLNRRSGYDESESGQIVDEVKQSDPAMILYSSGTTGRVKGVILTHRNLVALVAVLHFNKQIEGHQVRESEVSILSAPLFHMIGLLVLLNAAALGGTLVAMERFDFEAMLRAVERYKVKYLPASPPVVVALVKSELVRKYNLSSLQTVSSGGAPLGKAMVERFRKKFPNVRIGQGYGLTETTAGVARMVTPEEFERHGSVGRLVSNIEAKIVDPDTGEALPAGHTGELWCRGPTMMKGYVGNDKATAETLTSEGWLKTGDICYFDSEGFLYIVDRLKELIKYKAYQVPPAELEHLLQSIPEIADAAVIPYPDEDAGQIPMAYVVRKPGSNINAAQIMESIAKQVAPYKKIRRLAFVDSIPKNPAGKILRRELVRRAVSNATPKL